MGTELMGEPMVKAEGVHKRFGRLEVLKGIDLEVDRGQVLCMLGPSGSGKSTFLRCINHLEKINAGRLSVDGELVGYRESGGKLYELHDREICRKRAEIGMVFQHFNLFPHMTALDNVTLAPIRVLGVNRGEARTRAIELLNRVGLGDKLASYPVALSGGQQQRVAIARASARQRRNDDDRRHPRDGVRSRGRGQRRVHGRRRRGRDRTARRCARQPTARTHEGVPLEGALSGHRARAGEPSPSNRRIPSGGITGW